MRGDLHVHTHKSDGPQSALQVIEQASLIGLSHIAITDHDYMSYSDELASFASDKGVTLIDGVEISTMDKVRHRRVHILCYMPNNRKIIENICKFTTDLRVKAGRDMAKMVCDIYPIKLEAVEQIAKDGPCIYKQHITKVLMDWGYTTTIFGELYDNLFDFKKGSCIINIEQPNVYDVINLVREAGGIAVMAHPYTYNSIELLDELCEQNLLDGVEVWSSKSSPEQEEYLSNVADKYNLIKTGGSDFHGGYSSRISPLGSRYTPEQSLEALLQL